MRTTKSLLLVLVVTLIGSAFAATGEIHLKLNLKPGFKRVMQNTVDQNICQTIGGRQQKVHTNIQMQIAFEVLQSDPNGTVLLKLTYKKIRLQIEAPDSRITYDSDNSSQQPDSLAPHQRIISQAYGALIGQSIQMKVTSGGKILKIFGTDQLLQQVLARVQLDDPRAQQLVKQILESFLDKNRIKAVGATMLLAFPTTTVGIGRSWTDSVATQMPLPMKLETTYTLKEYAGPLAVIDANSVMTVDTATTESPAGLPMNFNVKGTYKGTLHVDTATGWLVGRKMKMHLAGTINVLQSPQTPQPLEIPMTIDSVITVEPAPTKRTSPPK